MGTKIHVSFVKYCVSCPKFVKMPFRQWEAWIWHLWCTTQNFVNTSWSSFILQMTKYEISFFVLYPCSQGQKLYALACSWSNTHMLMQLLLHVYLYTHTHTHIYIYTYVCRWSLVATTFADITQVDSRCCHDLGAAPCVAAAPEYRCKPVHPASQEWRICVAAVCWLERSP